MDTKKYDVTALLKNVNIYHTLEINHLQLFLLMMKNIRFSLKNMKGDLVYPNFSSESVSKTFEDHYKNAKKISSP